LTHNVHGPHDDSFYKYLAVLESEYEDLKRSGYSGEGFHSRGIRLGVGASHNLPPHLGRLKARDAAEKRKRAGESGGGRRLGGGNGGWGQLPLKELMSRVRVLFHAPSLWDPSFSCPPHVTEKFRSDSLMVLCPFPLLLLVIGGSF